MFCRKCGNEITEGTAFCPKCGAAQSETQGYGEFKRQGKGDVRGKSALGNKPKYTHCGYIGDWKLGPILRPIDFIIGVVLLIFGFIPGVVYLGVVAVIRSNPDRREKICPECKAQNMWTYIKD